MQNMKAYDIRINAWAFYHFAGNAFATIMMTTLLPIYYSDVAITPLSKNFATVSWGYANSLAVIIAVTLAPLVGALGNHFAWRKKFLLLFASIGIVLTSQFFFVQEGDWKAAIILYILAFVSYSLGDVFQDSLLPHVAKLDDIDRVSTRGYAFGYLGGGILLAICVVMLYFFQGTGFAFRLSFLSVSLWWALFTLPLLIFVKEPKEKEKLPIQAFSYIWQNRHLFLFLIAFLIYNDGIGTVMKMATIYGTEIGISPGAMIGALLMTQFVGIPFAFLFGRLAAPLGTKPCIMFGLFVYICISIGAYFMTTPLHFWILAFFVGTVQGGTQALSRSYFGRMIPKEKTAKLFGVYGMSSRMGGFVGPLVFAIVGQLTGDSRLSILSIIAFFSIGLLILWKLPCKK